MDEPDPKLAEDLAAFYYTAEDYGQVSEKEISPTLHALSQISKRYESPEFIAKGGMKQVFKVYDARCKRHVAMAMLHDDAPLELCDPLIHEAWLTALVDHPNIITVHDVGVDDRNRPYFTMDLKAGDSLGELLRKLRDGNSKEANRYPLESLLQMFVKICDAISYAHSIQVLHLDLKPANIQVGQYGEVLLCDWGLGRVLQQDSGMELERLLLNSDLLGSDTLFGEVRGTPGYMAPEQFQAESVRAEHADIYQLGCILYSILTLQRPVEGEPSEASAKTLRGEIVPACERAPERRIPVRLEAVAQKAMMVDPQQRYSSAEALGQEVRRYLMGFATEAEQAGVFTQLGLLYQRNKRFCLTVASCGLLLLFGTAWFASTLAEKESVASSAKRTAGFHLELFRRSETESEELAQQNTESVIRRVVAMHLNGSWQRAEQLLRAVLKDEPDNTVFHRAMGEHLFIRQRFNEASKYLLLGEKRSDWPDQLTCDLAHEYAEIKPDDEATLTVDQMVSLLSRIDGSPGFEAVIVTHDQETRRDPRDRAIIVEEQLRSINPNWKTGWFEYDFESSRLRVGGKGLKQLSTSHSILDGLRPRYLDISGSEISKLWKESDYGVETLDIRGCPLHGNGILRRFVHLRELITTPNQRDSKNHLIRKAVPPRVKITERELEIPLEK